MTTTVQKHSLQIEHNFVIVFSTYFVFFFPTLVPPDIEPFQFGDLSVPTLSGTRTRVICGLSRGDLPVAFHWLKDDRPIVQHNHQYFVHKESFEPIELAISSVDLFSSLLTINRLKLEHSGNYTCMAANPAGSTTYTATLRVKGDWLL